MLKLLTRILLPVERAYDRAKLIVKLRTGWWDALHVRPYLGYGTAGELRLSGRVLDDKRVVVSPEQTVWHNVRHTLRRLESDEVPGARVRLTDGATVRETTTDGEGYFSFRYLPADAPESPWHTVTLDLLDPAPEDPVEAQATARLLVPPAEASFGIISDLDDTVVVTGATDKLKYARAVLLNNEHTRLPFPGVGAFYRALRGGPDGDGFNPIFYVSSSPWNLFGQFHGFLRHRDIPEGPIFLKDFGLDEDKFIKSDHRSHKLDYIRTLLQAYPDLPFVLVGDSGQEDAEIYARAVREHPGRVRAVYIRDVSNHVRDHAIQRLAAETDALGVPMRAVQHSEEAARHAAELGLIPPGTVEAVVVDSVVEEQKDEAWWERLLR